MAAGTDGRIFVSGYFYDQGGILPSLLWLQTNGLIDSSFHAPTSLSAAAVALQPDGRAIIANGNCCSGQLLRLNGDGSLDAGFGPSSYVGGSVQAIAVQLDGKLVAAGNFTNVNGVTRHWLARLNADGSLDPNFASGASPGGGVGPIAGLHTVTLQKDGKLLIGGDFTDVGGTLRNGIARLQPDGSLDTTFEPRPAVSGVINTIVVQDNGRGIIAGYNVTANGSSGPEIAALNADGSVDTTFDPGSGTGGDAILSMVSQSDGKVVIGGSFATFNRVLRNRVARLNTDAAWTSLLIREAAPMTSSASSPSRPVAGCSLEANSAQ